MAIKVKKFTVDGEEYECTQLGAKQGRGLWLMLVKSMAGPVKQLGSMGKIDDVALVQALAIAVEGLDGDMVDRLCEIFGEKCTVRVPADAKSPERWPNLTGVIFDQHFAGKYVSLSKWLWECVTFNFLDFLGDLSLGNVSSRMQSLAAEARTKRETKSPSLPTDSTGSTGGS